MKMLLCLCLRQTPGGLSDIILPTTIQISPQKMFPSCVASRRPLMDTQTGNQWVGAQETGGNLGCSNATSDC